MVALMSTTQIPRLVLTLAIAAFCGGLVSCAGGPTYAEMKSTLPPLAKGEGRVFVYRPATVGFGVKPSVKIDDKTVGTSEGRGFFYTDQVAGSHQISITTEWKHKNTLDVVAGQPCFVECKMTPGLLVGHIIPNQVDTATGEANIQECKMGSGQSSVGERRSGEPAKATSEPSVKAGGQQKHKRDWGDP